MNSFIIQTLSACVLYSLLTTQVFAREKEPECEVCFKVLTRFDADLTDTDRGKEETLTNKFRKFCKKLKNKENRFCYFVGGTEDAATGILKYISQPLMYHKPIVKICADLKKMDSQICELKYDKMIDLANVDFKKLKVRDLKKILDDWDESNACKGCMEKSEYVRAVKDLMPKHAPVAAKAREDL